MEEVEVNQKRNAKTALLLFIISFAWIVPIVLMPKWFQGYSPVVIILDFICLAGMGFIWLIARKYGKKGTPSEKMQEPG